MDQDQTVSTGKYVSDTIRLSQAQGEEVVRMGALIPDFDGLNVDHGDVFDRIFQAGIDSLDSEDVVCDVYGEFKITEERAHELEALYTNPNKSVYVGICSS